LRKVDLIQIKKCDELLKKTPSKSDYSEVISQDCVFYKGGKAVGLYIRLSGKELLGIRKAALTTKLSKTCRTRGLPTQSSVFGSLPRIARRNDFCRYSAKTKEERENNDLIFGFSKRLLEIYQEHLPSNLERDLQVIDESVEMDYRIQKDSPFLTANINVNHAIKYHRDTGNFKGNLSNVLILRHGIAGGELVFPEYGFALSQDDGFLAIFDGQTEIHGVMPIIKTDDNPYRASIVYYSLEQMKHCYPYKEEVERLQQKATERAIKRKDH